MEKDIALGTVGGVKLTFTGGKAVVAVSASELVLNGAVQAVASVTVTMDAAALVDLLFAEIEAKSPAGAVGLEESVKSVIKSAVLAIA